MHFLNSLMTLIPMNPVGLCHGLKFVYLLHFLKLPYFISYKLINVFCDYESQLE